MFTLDNVVPWGRSYDEYRLMFALTEKDLSGSILGCGDGPAGFNAGCARRGVNVVSADPLYAFNAKEIRHRIAATSGEVIEQTRRNQHEFVWTDIPSVEDLARRRMAAMEDFLADYEIGLSEHRYLNAALPTLPFSDRSFDLALCSHLLFLYSAQFSEQFHHAAVLELCRVAKEIRIFPLLALGGRQSPFVASTITMLRHAGHVVTIEHVPYEFQRGANQILRIIPV